MRHEKAGKDEKHLAGAEPTVLKPKPMPDFVETSQVKDTTERALAYLAAGFPVHFRGASGTGKTTLAFHLAHLLGRPAVLLHGDEEFTTSDLVGGANGYRLRKVVDRFVSRVLKVEEDVSTRWVDSRITLACKNGLTLIYDEFTRSRPQANNVLLSVLQERILDLPLAAGVNEYLQVHPNFRAIFTSNPEEYAGVFRSQDALRDRMVTIDLDHFDEETETGITASKSGLSVEDARKIVSIVQDLRESGRCEFSPTVRGCLMVARTTQIVGARVSAQDPRFRAICLDVLASESSRVGSRKSLLRIRETVDELISKWC